MEIKDRGLNEKINQLKKGLEIIGGKSVLLCDDNSEILNYIIEKAFNDVSYFFILYTIELRVVNLFFRK